MRKLKTLFLFISLLLFFAFIYTEDDAEQWTRFRGPNGSGIALKAGPGVDWDSTSYLWVSELPGTGNASPVVWDNMIFVTSSDEEKQLGYLFAIDESSGDIMWQKEFHVGELKMHVDNKLAMPTPAVDELQVYVVWYSIDKTVLCAYSHKGDLNWETEFGGIEARHGGGNSPILTDRMVVFTREQEAGSSQKSSWLAVNKKTGETCWELERESALSNSFSTPFLMELASSEAQLIFSSMAHGITSVRPETGEVLWERKDILPDRAVSSPVYSEGYIVACRRGGGLVIAVDKNTKAAADTVCYSLPRQIAPYVPTPIVVDDLLFLFSDNGTISCLRFASGDILWKERPAGAIYGSPVCIGGILYCITKEGDVLVIRADEVYNLLGIHSLGEGSFSTPALCDKGLLFRTFTRLYLLPGNITN